MKSLLPLVLLTLIGCSTDTTAYKQASRIVVDSTLLDFDVVTVGESASRTITLTHTTGDDVQVVGLQLVNHDGDNFSTLTDGFPVVPKDGTASFDVTYTPLADGFHTGQLTIVTSEEEDNEHVVDLRGQSAAIDLYAWPSLVDFGSVEVGDMQTATVTVDNNGILEATIESATVVDADFAVTTTLPLSVAPGDSVEIQVSFTPSADLADETQLQIVSADGTTTIVTLRGNDCEHGDPTRYDLDADGYTTCGGDCDDGSASIHPGAAETCDDDDDDCDGDIDEGTSCADDDGDSYTENAGDCNDAADQVHPGAEELLGDGIDNDCDGIVDSGSEDLDGDGYTAAGGDCDDGADTIHPGATESGNGWDDDCDGTIDEGTTLYDDDGDGLSESAGDCDDSSVDINPSAAEVGDGMDNDCDGAVDEGTTRADDDGDGFTELGGDCDDADPSVNPGEWESSGNGIDDDCDGVTE